MQERDELARDGLKAWAPSADGAVHGAFFGTGRSVFGLERLWSGSARPRRLRRFRTWLARLVAPWVEDHGG